MTTPTHSHKAWTDKGGHVKSAVPVGNSNAAIIPRGGQRCG